MYNFSQKPDNRLGLVMDFNEGGNAMLCGMNYGATQCNDLFPNAITTWLNTFGKMPPGELPKAGTVLDAPPPPCA